MADSQIIQRIRLEGGPEIEAALQRIAQAGTDAFQKLQQAGQSIGGDEHIGAIDSAAKRLGISYDEMRQKVAAASAGVNEAGGKFAQFGQQLGETSRFAKLAEVAGVALGASFRGLGSIGATALNGLTTLNFGIGGFVERIKGAGIETLKAVGIIGGLPAALYAIATKASNTSFELEHEAEAAGTSVEKLQDFKSTLASAGIEGQNFDRALHMVSAASAQVEKAFYDAEISTRKFYQAQRDGAQDLGTNQARAIEDFETRIRRAGKSLSDPEVQKQYRELLEDQATAQKRHLEDQSKAQQRFFRDQQQKLSEAGGAWTRYGIALVDATGHARDPLDVLKDLGEKLSGMGSHADQAAAAAALLSRRIGPNLLPALLKYGEGAHGAAGELDKLTGATKRYTETNADAKFRRIGEESLHAGVLFRQARTGFEADLKAISTRIGNAFAPGLTQATKDFDAAMRANSGSAEHFAETLATKAKPLIEDFVKLLTGKGNEIPEGSPILVAKKIFTDLGQAALFGAQVIGNAFKIVHGAIDGLVSGFNKLFGTKVSVEDVAVLLVVTKLIGGFLRAIGVIQLVSGSFGLLRAGLAAVGVAFGPVGIAIAAVGIALGILAVKLAGLDWSTVKDAASKAWDDIVAGAEELWNKLGSVFGAGVGRIAAIIAGVAASFLAFSAFSGILGTITTAVLGFGASLLSLPALITAAAAAGVAFFAVWAYNNWDTIKSAASAVWEAIKTGASSLWSGIKSLWSSGVDAISGAWDTIKSAASSVFGAIGDTVSKMWQGLTKVASSALDAVANSLQASGLEKLATAMNNAAQAATSMGSTFDQVLSNMVTQIGAAVDKMNALAEAAQNAAQAASQAVQDVQSSIDTSQSSSDTSTGYASGGMIHGPGTTTSDSVPVLASRGEFITRASAVSHYGSGLFHALNRMSLPRFNMGGLVTAMQSLMPPMPSLRFAQGGMVPAVSSGGNLRPVNIHLDGHRFGMLAANDVADSLVRVATNAQVRSAGRKPSYFGRGR